MAGLGERSIEVSIINNSGGNLRVDSANLFQGTEWVSGEEAKKGQVIEQRHGTVWGAMTNGDGTVQATISIGGYGDPPVTLQMTNDYLGNSSLLVSKNDRVSNVQEKVDTPDANHTAYQVQFIPTPDGSGGLPLVVRLSRKKGA